MRAQALPVQHDALRQVSLTPLLPQQQQLSPVRAVVVRRFSTMLLVHYFLPEVGVKMETVQQQRLLRSMSERPQVRPHVCEITSRTRRGARRSELECGWVHR